MPPKKQIPPKKKKLTVKQERFAKEYKVDGVASKAAIRAGYPRNRAKQTGYELLQRVTVKEVVESELDKAKRERERDIKDTMKELHGIALKPVDEGSEFNYPHKLRALEIDLKAMGVTDKPSQTNIQFNENKILHFLRAAGKDVSEFEIRDEDEVS